MTSSGEEKKVEVYGLTALAEDAWALSRLKRKGYVLLELYYAKPESRWLRGKVFNPETGKIERFWFDEQYGRWRRRSAKPGAGLCPAPRSTGTALPVLTSQGY